MPGHDIIAIGASAGGVEALTKLVKNLPSDLPAAVFVVLHVPSHGTSVLPQILNRAGSLKAAHARDGEAIEYGRIYVAPPNHHLLVKRGKIRLTRGPRENGHRPAVDPLFRTAARAYGRRSVGVVLSGSLDDGTAGLMAVKSRDGVAVVQDPEEALFSGMPSSAIENVAVDYILPLSDIGAILIKLAYDKVEEEEEKPVSPEMEIESDMAELELDALHKDDRPGNPAGFACPGCGGALWELNEGNLLRFRCRTGHAYSPKTLLAEQSESLEEALWVALRALEESSALGHRMAKRARDRNHTTSAARFEEQAQEALQRATLIRDVLMKGELEVS
jgi:two-component system chemotaxis response regulator CheB